MEKKTADITTYSMLKSYVSYRKPRKIRDVQREKAGSKMKGINQVKSIVVN